MFNSECQLSIPGLGLSKIEFLRVFLLEFSMSESLSGEELQAKVLELLPALKEELGKDAVDCTDTLLMKFLFWKPNVTRAAERFRAHQKWRKDSPFAVCA